MNIFDSIYEAFGISTLIDGMRDETKTEEPAYIQQPIGTVKFQYRPQDFDSLIGQDKAKDKSRLAIQLIKKGFPRHFLLTGNAGHGKTTLAGIIANESKFNFNIYVGSNFEIETFKDFLIRNEEGSLKNSELPNVLFIDEIAGLKKDILTYMLPIIEDFKLGDINLRKFIMIGATTDSWMISKRCQPFMDRIQCQINLENYTANEIKQLLIQYNDQIHKANVTTEQYDIISHNCKYTPRLAISLFDYFITAGDLNKVLAMNRIIKNSCDDVDIHVLKYLMSLNGKFAGEEVLSIIANISRQEYKEQREPFLIREELITRGSRGRSITDKGKLFLQDIK